MWRFPVAGVLVLASLALTPPALAETPEARRLARAIDAYVMPLIDAGHLSGQLLVARHGQVLVERQYGWADWELRAPMTPETRFCIASVTKPMTSTIAIQLMAEKKFGYRDSIARWLPDFPRADRMTVEHLLRHRSGIRHQVVPDSEATRPMTTVEVVARAARLPLDHEPGARGGYSSGGFSVLVRVLELATGKSYRELLDEWILRPLGMTHTSDDDRRALLPGRSVPVAPGARGLENAAYQDFSAIVGAGSVWSTARDLHRFVQGVTGGKLGPGPQFSFVRSGKLDFNGIAGGFRAFCDWDSATGLEVIFVGNLQTGAPDLLRRVMPRLAAGESVPPPMLPALRAAALPESELRQYEATFELGNRTRLLMSVRDGALWANDWVLLPMADGGFFSPRDYGKVRGVKGADGRIERLDWEQRGEVYPAPRVAG